tara:strand:- start:50 stop:304 length:255 start_codon:yes stop_codon:yes gene_type:complete
MTNNYELEKEYKEIQKEDQDKRKGSIKDGQELDKNIQKRMKAGEIGVSHGIDNHIGVIMFATATIVTILALYFIFGVIPDRYAG